MVKKARTLSLTFFLALILILAPVFSASAETAKNSWNGITWEFESVLGALFINGRGVLPVEAPMPWRDRAADNRTLCFDSGVTEIPSGFTEGCVNMKTVMLPATLQSIGKGVLSVSGGLREIYYEGSVEELLAIQMDSEDRNALNGAFFYASEIVKDEKTGAVSYVPLEDGQRGRLKIYLGDGVVMGTLDDGAVYTAYYGNNGYLNYADIVGDDYTAEYRVTRREDNTIASITYETTKDDYAGTMTRYYDETGSTVIKQVFVKENGETDIAEYDDTGTVLLKNTLEWPNGESLSRVYRPDGTLERAHYIYVGAPYYQKDKLYDLDGKTLLSETTLYTNGGQETREYDSVGMLIRKTTTEERGAQMILEYGHNGALLRQTYTQPDGYSVIEEYGDEEKLVKETRIFTDGRNRCLEYNTAGSIIRVTEISAAGVVEIGEYDDDGNQLFYSIVSPDGSSMSNAYSPSGALLKSTQVDAYQNRYELEYLEDGSSIYTETYAPGLVVDPVSGKGIVKSTLYYDTLGYPTSAITIMDDNSYFTEAFTENGDLLQINYDSEGVILAELVTEDYGTGRATQTVYQEDGSRIVTIMEVDGSSEVHYYDPDGNEVFNRGEALSNAPESSGKDAQTQEEKNNLHLVEDAAAVTGEGLACFRPETSELCYWDGEKAASIVLDELQKAAVIAAGQSAVLTVEDGALTQVSIPASALAEDGRAAAGGDAVFVELGGDALPEPAQITYVKDGENCVLYKADPPSGEAEKTAPSTSGDSVTVPGPDAPASTASDAACDTAADSPAPADKPEGAETSPAPADKPEAAEASPAAESHSSPSSGEEKSE